MKHVVGWLRGNFLVVLVFDIVLLAAIMVFLAPRSGRPLDLLLGVVICLAVLTGVAASRNGWRCAAIVVASLAIALLAPEMVAKFRNTKEPGRYRVSADNPYDWSGADIKGYMRARERALRDGVDDGALADYTPVDSFPAEVVSNLLVERHDMGTGWMTETAEKLPFYSFTESIGAEPTPDNLVHYVIDEKDSGNIAHDFMIRIDPFGCRETPGSEGAEDVFVFLGCSFTFGSYVDQRQTWPYYLSEMFGFSKRMMNLAISGTGPAHALRDLELNYRMGKAGIEPTRVKAVFYGLMDDQLGRVDRQPKYGIGAPYYELDKSGKPVFVEVVHSKYSSSTRLEQFLGKTRFYGKLVEKIRMNPLFSVNENRWNKIHAILGAINDICRERYGTALTVVYWGSNPEVEKRILAAGMRLVRASDAYGEEWKKVPVRYEVFDGHPNGYANKKVAELVFKHMKTWNNRVAPR